jgi:integrase
LQTDVFSVAEQRVTKKVAELKRGTQADKALRRGLATVGDAAQAYQTQVELDPQLKPASVHYRIMTIAGLFRSWPELESRKLADVSPFDCERWAARYAKAVHGTRFNNTVDTLRHIFQVGIDRGLIHRNPASGIGKVKPAPKKLLLPTREQFAQLLKEIETSGSWCGMECSDLVRFLAYSGCRVTEASHVEWKHVDGEKGTITIEGSPEHGTKNRERRTIPIIPPMRELLDRLADREREPRRVHRSGYVLHVTECHGALATACAKIGLPKLDHHDMRHLFATRAIEGGVDIPTVARWLGHKDGGALAMKTYGHLRQEHSLAMAQRVSF